MVYINPVSRPTQPALLQSATTSPININYYEDQDDVFQLAAVLSLKVMKNHAFQDGNKRTALLAADMFLKINGYKLRAVAVEADIPSRGWETLEGGVVKACTGTWEREDLGRYFGEISTKIEERSSRAR